MEIKTCVNCYREAVKEIELVTIKTMEDRGFRKTKIYQAMGDIISVSVCDHCVNHYIEQQYHYKKKNRIQIFATALLLLISLVVIRSTHSNSITLFAVVITIAFVASCVQEIKKRTERVKVMKNRSHEQNRRLMEVEFLSKKLPKKHVDAKLTYIALDRILNDNTKDLSSEYGISQKKLLSIRHYLNQEGKQEALRRQEEMKEQVKYLDKKSSKKIYKRISKAN